MIQHRPHPFARRLWNDGLIGLDHIHPGPQSAQFTRNHIAGHFGARQQDSFPFYASPQTCDYGFGDILLGHDIHLDSMIFNRPPGGGTDGRNLEMREALRLEPKFLQTLPQRLNSVDAGQDQPVVLGQIRQSTVERLERPGPPNFYKGNLHYLRPQIPEAG